MSLELLSTIAAFGTFLVIAATAFAAVVQLRHLRSSNQISAFDGVRDAIEAPEFIAARRFIQNELPWLLKEPHFAERLSQRMLDPDLASLNLVGNEFENLGVLCKYGIIDKRVACDLFSGPVLSSWAAMVPFIAIRRRILDAPAYFENFEYLAMLWEDFDERHPDGAYPRGAPVKLTGPMQVSWLPNSDLGYMIGDYLSTSFVGSIPLSTFPVAAAPKGGLFEQAIFTANGLETAFGGLQRSSAGERPYPQRYPVLPRPIIVLH